MYWPKITIVTPSFNQEKFLRRTLESIYIQQYPNLEHIVIDGGSTDGSINILKEYDSQITYWSSEPDEGQTHALIKGFERATGDILCWLNSDDLFEHYTLRTIGQYFLDHPEAEFVYGNATWINPDDSLLYKRHEMEFIKWIWLYTYNYIPQPSSFWRRQLYWRVGGLDKNFSLSMDGDLFSRFSNVTVIRHIPAFLSRFRYYPDQRNQKFRKESIEEDGVIMIRELGREANKLEFFVLRNLGKSIRFLNRSLKKLGLENV